MYKNEAWLKTRESFAWEAIDLPAARLGLSSMEDVIYCTQYSKEWSCVRNVDVDNVEVILDSATEDIIKIH